MRRVIGVALITFAALAQVTWAPRAEVAGAFPNLVLLAVVAVTWVQGAPSALVWSCVGGLLLDLMSTGPVGPHALALLVPVYGIGLWTHGFERATALHVAVSAALTTVVYSLIIVATDHLVGLPAPTPLTIGQLILAAATYNAVLSPFALELVRRLHNFARSAPEAD